MTHHLTLTNHEAWLMPLRQIEKSDLENALEALMYRMPPGKAASEDRKDARHCAAVLPAEDVRDALIAALRGA